MILIIGGRYQGKLEYAMNLCSTTENFHNNRDNFDKLVYNCQDVDWSGMNCATVPELSKKCIYRLEAYSQAMVKAGFSPETAFRQAVSNEENCLDGKILICDDISQGIVPMDKTQRLWREENGRMLIYLASRATKVIRVFCGLGMILKGDEEGEN